MAKKIALFNHKGGVSKTTTTFNVSWMLANMGRKVIMVDTDPQCNLTGFTLGFDKFEEFYQNNPKQTIKEALAPAFESRPKYVEAIECLDTNNENLFLLPGDITLSEYDVTLGLSQEISGSVPALHNVPGAINFLLDKEAERYDADYIMIDMSPSLSSINQNLLMISDAFIVPTSPDYFSLMAIKSLAKTIPRWINWRNQFIELQKLQDPSYIFPSVALQFLGIIIQNYRIRNNEPTSGFQSWIQKINEEVNTTLIPALQKCGISTTGTNPCLSMISNFNTLMPKSQIHSVPVFALSDEQIALRGAALNTAKEAQEQFCHDFQKIADAIVAL